jgi:uncharacterized protein YgbK (DUF1537 family)
MTRTPSPAAKKLRFGLIADDLTGASDCGVQFSRKGAAVLVLVSMGRLPEIAGQGWDVVALNTDSRNLEPEEAAAKVGKGVDYLARGGWPLRYKKIDSTLRGNLIPELEPILADAGVRACFAPAFPLSGRTVEHGVLKVGGVPVHETEVGHDALSPVRESRLLNLLGLSRVLRPASISLETVGAGVDATAAEMSRAFAKGHNVVVCDASRQEHLASAARALLCSHADAVVVGSAGMARELGQLLFPGRPAPALPPAREGPVLVAAGSRNPVTREQVALLARQPGAVLHTVQPEEVEGVWNPERQRNLADAAAAALAASTAGGATCLALALADTGASAAEQPAAFRERSRRLNALLGAIIALTLARLPLRGLVLTGGDVAAAALDALQVQALRLGPEVLPGIPLSWLIGGEHPELRLVTKAGGFGAPDALRLAVAALNA